MEPKIRYFKKEDIICVGENSVEETPELCPNRLGIDLTKVATVAFYEKPSPHTHLSFVGNLPTIVVKGEVDL